MDLFEYNYMQRGEQNAPLASRMRPVVLDEFVGQEHIIGKDKILYRTIKLYYIIWTIRNRKNYTSKNYSKYNKK